MALARVRRLAVTPTLAPIIKSDCRKIEMSISDSSQIINQKKQMQTDAKVSYCISSNSSMNPSGITTSQRRAESTTMAQMVICDEGPRQRRLIWVGAAYRLAMVALLPSLTYVASSLGYELDRVVQELDNQGYQAQESIQPVHRQFTSSQGRRRCRLTGLTPLTYRHYSRLEAILQTYVRYCSRAQPSFEHRPPASRCLTPYTKMPEKVIRQQYGEMSSNASRKVIAVFSKPARAFPVQAHPIYLSPRIRHAATSKTSGLFTQDMRRDRFPLVSLQPTVMNSSRRGICHG